MYNITNSQKIVEILEFWVFMNVIIFRKNDKTQINKVQKDKINVSVAVYMV